MMNLQKHIIKAICIIGCITQLFIAIRNFLRFNVRYGVQIDYPQSYELPNIDFIIPLAAYLNQTELTKRFNATLQEYADDLEISLEHLYKCKYALSEILSTEIKVKDIEELMLNPEDDIFILSVKELNNNILKKYCKIDKYFSSKYIYLRVSCLNNSKPVVISSETISTDNRILVKIAHEINSMFSIRLSDISSKIDSRIRSYTVIPTFKGRLAFTQITFKKIHYNALSHPYTTDCKDYDKPNELHNCVRNTMLNLPNQTLYSSAILSFNQYPGHLGFQQISDKDRNSIYQKCTKLTTKIECHSLTYELRIDIIDEKVQGAFKILNIVPSIDPDIHYLAYPVQEYTEFIIFFMSILSNWFGLSIFDQLIHSTSYCKTYTKRKINSCKRNLENGCQTIEVETIYSIQTTQKLFKPRQLFRH